MKATLKRTVINALVLLAGTYAVLAGHHHLALLLAEDLLRADLPIPGSFATLISSAFVQLGVGAFWIPFAYLCLRLGCDLQAARLCLRVTLVTLIIRVVVEVATGTVLGDFPTLIASATAVGAVLALTRGAQPVRRRVRAAGLGRVARRQDAA